MTQHTGYLIDLTTVKLDESNGVVSSWIQAAPLGAYQHPLHGLIDFTLERIGRFAENVKANVRGQELDIDYDHKERTSEAAGWVKDAEARSDGLWILVEWTKDAAAKIKNKAYKYFSPEFVDEWTHPVSGTKFQDVMFGGGITNRPFLKGILPINLSEAFAADKQIHNNQGGQMDPKKLRELLGLPEDATDEQVMTKLTEVTKEQAPQAKDDNKQLSEALAKLAEENPAIKSLQEKLEAQSQQLAEQAATLRLSEIGVQLSEVTASAAAKKRAVPPAVMDSLKALMIKAPKQFSDELLVVVKQLGEVGFVELGERAGQSGGDDKPAAERFVDAVKKLQEDNKDLSYGDAVERVAAGDPKLFSEYQSDSYAFRV